MARIPCLRPLAPSPRAVITALSLCLFALAVNALPSTSSLVPQNPSLVSSTAPQLASSVSRVLSQRSSGVAGALKQLRGGGILHRLRREYEFSTGDEEVFRVSSKMMRHVASGFVIHSFFQAINVLKEVKRRGIKAIPSFGDCLDELWYAWFIFSASGAFEEIYSSSGRDLEHLMEAVELQQKLWKKMRIPLYVKTTIMAIGILKDLVLWILANKQATEILRTVLQLMKFPIMKALFSAEQLAQWIGLSRSVIATPYPDAPSSPVPPSSIKQSKSYDSVSGVLNSLWVSQV